MGESRNKRYKYLRVHVSMYLHCMYECCKILRVDNQQYLVFLCTTTFSIYMLWFQFIFGEKVLKLVEFLCSLIVMYSFP